MDSTSLRARPGSPREPQSARARRLSSSVWLPWLVGLIALLLVGAASVVLVGRDRGQEGVSESIIVAQERAAEAAGQFFRRSTNEGVADLTTAAAQLTAAPSADLEGTLQQMLVSQERWTSLAAIDENGSVLASVGDGEASRFVDVDVHSDPGVTVAESDGRVLLASYAPLVRADEPAALLIGVSDQLILDVSLAAGQPGPVYAVDDEGRVLASYGLPTEVADLPDEELRAAAGRGSSGSVGAAVPEVVDGVARVVSWAPVAGQGPTGSLGWAVVVEQSVDELIAPDARYRSPGMAFGGILIVVALAVFGWIWLRVLRPLALLEDEAERVAYGDLSRAVPVVHFDEVGRIARALERLRLQLIGRRVGRSGQDALPVPDSPDAPLILVADDDQLVRSLLTMGLGRAGFRVIEAVDGPSALVATRDSLPSLVLLDWMMPGMAGVDVCQAIKSDPRTAGIHVVMATTVGDEAQVTEAFQAGADEYLTKPFDIREVMALVTRAVGGPE